MKLREGREALVILEQSDVSKCDSCDGSGTVLIKTGEYAYKYYEKCNYCGGNGFIISRKKVREIKDEL